MKNNLLIIFGLFIILSVISCEEEVIPSNTGYEPEYVVESYLEQSSEALPPYLFLTKSLGFYAKFDTGILNNLFVSNATVHVVVDQISYPLEEVCISQLPPDIRKEVLKNFGFNSDSVKVDFCAYIDLNKNIPILVDKKYQLEIIVNQDTVRSTTTIPPIVRLDSFWFQDIPGKSNDTFAQLFCIIDDKAARNDYYRYFSAGMNENLIPNFGSVTNDFFFDGQKFKFTLSKAVPPGETFNDNSGYFKRGDTIRVKWCNIDKPHFEFWNTLEVSRTRQGPFSSYVRIKGNIENGLGIFGGQNCEIYSLYVPKK
ncbi:MAG: DUF4249 family protein [Saprospiraceae bacterium]